MAILNRKSKLYVEETITGALVVSVSNNQMFFSRAITKIGKLEKGRYITFIETNRLSWLFACNDDSSGFPIGTVTVRGRACINDAALIRVFLKQTEHKAPASFMVLKERYLDGDEEQSNPIFEILVNKTLQQLKKH